MASPAPETLTAPGDRQAWRWPANPRALLEILLFVAVTLAIDHFFFDGHRFRTVTLHPFWLMVLLVSVQYGVAEGLAAALAGTAALWIGNLPPARLDQDLYGYWLGVAAMPAAWLAAAVLFGELRARDRRRIIVLSRALADGERQNETLSRAYDEISAAKRELEARVAGQLRTVFSIYQAAKAIERLGPGEVLSGVAELVRAILSAKRFSVFLLKGDALEAIALESVVTEGWGADERLPERYDAGSALFQAVVGGQRFLCAARAADAGILGDDGVLAGPILSAEGRVLGMLKIEGLAFLDLNLTAIENFRIVCDWIGTAFAKAQAFETAASDSLYSSERMMLSTSFLERQIAFLTSLGRRMKFDVTLLEVTITGAEQAAEADRLLYARTVGEVVGRSLRNTDLAFDHKRSGFEFAVLLPATSTAEARIVANKLERAVREQLGAAQAEAAGITIGVRALVQGAAP
ncbi:MAG: GAF domain-containing protein [Ferrovibrionaceae bacterium]